jgi:hypothetical protein
MPEGRYFVAAFVESLPFVSPNSPAMNGLAMQS